MSAVAAGALYYQQNRSDFRTLSGEAYQWQSLRGEWIVVNYFAEWCAPCLKEVPELNAFDQFADTQSDIRLFAMSYDAISDQALTDLKHKYDMHFSLISTDDPSMPMARPAQLPATYIISPQGEVMKPLMGEQTNQGLQEILSALKGL